MKTDRKHIVFATAVILACFGLGQLYLYMARVLYENTANTHRQRERHMERKSSPGNGSAVDSAISLLKTGDLVVRRGDDMTSYMLANLNLQDKTFSHCGIVVIEVGQPYVYHCIGGEDNPDELMRKDPAAQWFSPANNLSFAVYRYDFDDTALMRLTKQVDNYYLEQKMFDMDFDLETDDRMYCSEMIYKAISIATGDAGYIKSGKGYGKKFVGVDDLYLNKHVKCICQVKFK